MVRLWEMANVLSKEKQEQIKALGRLGWSLRRIEREAQVRRETASRYLKAAGLEVRGRGGGPPKPATLPGVITDPGDNAHPKPATLPEVITDPKSGEVNSKPATSPEVITDPSPAPSDRARPPRRVSESRCEPYRTVIERWVDDGRTMMSIWQALVDAHGFAGRYASVQRFVHSMQGVRTPEARVVMVTRPGEEAQVDYGDGPMVRDAATGKYKRVRLFLMTLAHSRKAVRLLAEKSSSQIWAQLHEEAFRRLGGVTATVVLDNLREGIIKPDVYDPIVNPLYRDVLAHYGVVALPCRVRDPDRKGKVEAGIGHTQKALRGLRFESLAAAQAWLDHWDTRWADTRIHGTTKRQVAAMFANEQPHLRPLPTAPFRYYAFATRVVHLDGYVEIGRAYYAPPPGFIGRSLQVQWDERVVRLLDPSTGLLLREHLRALPGRHRMAPTDAPSRTPLGVTALLQRAHGIGEATGRIAEVMYAHHPQLGLRGILGLCSLAKKHGAGEVERAAQTALQAGARTYRAVKACLAHRQQLPVGVRQIDPIIRELTEYRDLIGRMTSAAPTSQTNPPTTASSANSSQTTTGATP